MGWHGMMGKGRREENGGEDLVGHSQGGQTRREENKCIGLGKAFETPAGLGLELSCCSLLHVVRGD